MHHQNPAFINGILFLHPVSHAVPLHETAPPPPPPGWVVCPGPVEANVLEPELGTTRMAAAKAEIPTLVNTLATFVQILRMIQSSIGLSAIPPLASPDGLPPVGCLLLQGSFRFIASRTYYPALKAGQDSPLFLTVRVVKLKFLLEQTRRSLKSGVYGYRHGTARRNRNR